MILYPVTKAETIHIQLQCGHVFRFDGGYGSSYARVVQLLKQKLAGVFVL